MIIGPHGAGLVNMLFAPNDTAVVELQSPSLSLGAHAPSPSSSWINSSVGGSVGFAGVAGAGHNRAPNMNYWHLASALGLEHWTLFASPDGPEDQQPGLHDTASGSVRAAVNPLLQVVEDILLRSGGKAGPRRPVLGMRQAYGSVSTLIVPH